MKINILINLKKLILKAIKENKYNKRKLLSITLNDKFLFILLYVNVLVVLFIFLYLSLKII